MVGLVWFFTGLGLYSLPFIFQNPKFLCQGSIDSHQLYLSSQQAFNNGLNTIQYSSLQGYAQQFNHQHIKSQNLFDINSINYESIYNENKDNKKSPPQSEGYECWENEIACKKQVIVLTNQQNQLRSSLTSEFSLYCNQYSHKIFLIGQFFLGGVLGLLISQLYISNKFGQAIQMKFYLFFQMINISCLCYFDIDYIQTCFHLFFAGFLGFSFWSVSQTYMRDICAREFFQDYRCALFFLNTISQMGITLFFTFNQEWRKSLLYGIAIPQAVLFCLITYFMIENPRFLLGNAPCSRVYKVFSDIQKFNDTKKFFTPKQFEIIHSKLIANLKQKSPQNQNHEARENNAGHRMVMPLSYPSSSSNLSHSQINRQQNNQNNINFINELNNRINSSSSPQNFNQIQIPNSQLQQQQQIQQQQRQQFSMNLDQQQNMMNFNGNNNQNLGQNGKPQYYQSLLNENKMEENQQQRNNQHQNDQNANIIDINLNNNIFQNKCETQSMQKYQFGDDKSIDKISIISFHNATPEIMSNIFQKTQSNQQLQNNNQGKFNPSQQLDYSHSQNQNNTKNNLNNSIQQQNNQLQVYQQEHQQNQININNVQTEYVQSRSQTNLQNLQENNTQQIMRNYQNSRDNEEETKNNYLDQQSQISNNIQRQVIINNQNIENNVCEESENQFPINEKLQLQEYIKRLAVYILVSITFTGMYYMYYFELDKIGINLSYNIFILGLSEFIAILFADKFIEFPDPRNTVKQCLFIGGVLSAGFVMMRQSKECEATYVGVCPEKIVQLLFLALIRFLAVFGQSFLIRNFKLMESSGHIKEVTWKYVTGFGLIGVFIPLTILLVTRNIYSTIFIFGSLSILISQFFRN